MSEYAFTSEPAERLVAELTPTLDVADRDTLRRYCDVLVASHRELAKRHYAAPGLTDVVLEDGRELAGAPEGWSNAQAVRDVLGPKVTAFAAAAADLRRLADGLYRVTKPWAHPDDP